jgi:hypothetical protein
MTNTNTTERRFLGNMIDIFGAAVGAAAAVDGRRQPSARDLKTLGIDPCAFPGSRTR